MSPSPPKELVELQEWFSQAVSARNNHTYLEDSERYITRSSRQDTSERLSIYADDFWPRVINALGDDFNILKQHLGSDEFEKWVRLYIEKHPSTSFTLYYIGRHFTQFLRDEYDHSDKQLVVDMASYEWATCSAFFAANVDAFSVANRSAPAESLLATKIGLHPSVTLLELHHDPRTFLDTNVNSTDSFLVVFRKDFKIKEESVDSNFFMVLRYIRKGGNLEDIIDELASNEAETDVEQCVQNMQDYFAQMVQSHWIITL
jgi:hypothetical protein